MCKGVFILVCCTFQVGTPLCIPSREFIEIGRIASMEVNHKVVDTAKKGNTVAMKVMLLSLSYLFMGSVLSHWMLPIHDSTWDRQCMSGQLFLMGDSSGVMLVYYGLNFISVGRASVYRAYLCEPSGAFFWAILVSQVFSLFWSWKIEAWVHPSQVPGLCFGRIIKSCLYVQIVGTNAEETQKMYGRHFDMEDEFVSSITRKSIDLLKENYRVSHECPIWFQSSVFYCYLMWTVLSSACELYINLVLFAVQDDLTMEDWRLLVKLKKLFEIP